MTTHTPGPWTVANYRPNAGQPFIIDAPAASPGLSIAVAVVQGTDGDKSNASLIAAAPDLLEACQQHHNAALKARALMSRNEFEEARRVLTEANLTSRAAIAMARIAE